MKKIDDWIVNSIILYYLKKFELEGIKKLTKVSCGSRVSQRGFFVRRLLQKNTTVFGENWDRTIREKILVHAQRRDGDS